MQIFIAILFLAGLGLIFGLGLGVAAKVFALKVDPRLEEILQLLPGSNCGACGRAGCFGFAQALIGEGLDPCACRVSAQEVKLKIAQILGKELKETTKVVAVLHCEGGIKVKDRFFYAGVKDCRMAGLLLGGQKECLWGCLGLGSCVEACPFGAISMSKEALPRIDKHKCTACGRCVSVCPKHLFSLAPIDSYYVACSSLDNPAQTKKVCSVGCIACGVCTKVKGSSFYLKDNLSRIDYSQPKDKEAFEEAKKRCPTKCILKV